MKIMKNKKKDEVSKLVKDVLDWIDKNPDAKIDEVEEKKEKLEDSIDKAEKKAKFRREILSDNNKIRNRMDDKNDPLSELSSNDKKKLKEAMQEFEDWLKKNPNATEDEIEKQRKKM